MKRTISWLLVICLLVSALPHGALAAADDPQASAVAVTGLRLSETELALSVAEQRTLRASVLPENAAEQTVVWNSDNEKVATVDEHGVVTGRANGRAAVTATTKDGGFTASCQVTVGTGIQRQNLYWNIGGQRVESFGRVTVKYGDVGYITAQAEESGGGAITYISANPSRVFIDPVTGEFTVIRGGTAQIKATAAEVEGRYAAATIYLYLTIDPLDLTVRALDQTIVYGEEIRRDRSQVNVFGLRSGDELHSFTLTPSTADVPGGQVLVSEASVTRKTGGNDVTSCYNIVYEPGELTIRQKVVDDPVIELEFDTAEYNGQPHEPGVTVKDGERVIPESEYWVSYSNNFFGGTATVTISDMEGGNYRVNGQTHFTINGHRPELRNEKEATCTENGYSGDMICAICEKTVTEGTVIPALGHDLILLPELAPSCTGPGLTAGESCTRCAYCREQEVLPALGHDYVDGICTRCGGLDPVVDPSYPRFTVGSGTGRVGDTVTLELTVSNNPGIVSAYLDLTYDRSKLELVNAEDTGLFQGAMFSNDKSRVPFALNWDDSLSPENNTGNGVIALLTFRVREGCPDGPVPVEISCKEGNVINTDLEAVSFVCAGGQVEVVSYLLGDVNGDMQITAKDVAVLRRYLARWDDVNIVEPAADVDRDGRITAKDVALLRRYLAYWEGISLESSLAPTSLWNGILSRHGRQSGGEAALAVSGAVGKAGELVTVEVSLTDDPGLVSLYLELNYDRTKLALVRAEDTRLLNGGLFGSDVSRAPFALTWDDSLAPAGQYGTGVIARLTFKVLEDCGLGETSVQVRPMQGGVLDHSLRDVALGAAAGTVRTVPGEGDPERSSGSWRAEVPADAVP